MKLLSNMKKYIVKKVVRFAINRISDEQIIKWGESLSNYVINNREQIQDMIENAIDPVEVKIEEKTLTEIAEATGGQYRRAVDQKSLKDIYTEIDKLEKQKISTIEYHVDLPEMAYIFILIGLCLVILNLILSKLLLKSINI